MSPVLESSTASASKKFHLLKHLIIKNNKKFVFEMKTNHRAYCRTASSRYISLCAILRFCM